MLNGKTVLITGGTGSFGKKMVQAVLKRFTPKALIVFSRDELKQFEMAQKFNPQKYPFLKYVLGDVRDRDRLRSVFQGVDFVVHAAALKQVPTAERNPDEFIKTNVIGAMNIIEVASECNVDKVIALSTDKACNPINLYGATKLCSDKLFMAANSQNEEHKTCFAVVRYGNVLGSRGSVVPFFQERAKVGTLPITDDRMTRFWITLDQAVDLVLFAISHAKGGELFVPKIPSMKIIDLARAIAPECKHEIVGIRPGEKIHEVLISEDDARQALEFKNCFVVQANPLRREDLMKQGGRLCPEGFEYASDKNTQWLSVNDLGTMVKSISADYEIETSRWSLEGVPQ